MDKIIKKVMNSIEREGFECFIVGGYVRDLLLGISSYDVDICTNALPKDVHRIFSISNQNNYGGSNLKIGKYNIDITTYREEFKYIGRKPTEIKYINDLKNDLKRRDFTINAICMDSKGKVIDLVGGVKDLNDHVLRMIGDPNEKMCDDPLRILRTIRFASVLDFNIDEKLLEALEKNYKLVSVLSKERVKQEYSKILMHKNFKKGLELSKKIGINEVLGIKYNDVVYSSDLLGMWSQVEIDNMPFTKEEKSNIIKISEVLKYGVIDNFVLYKYGLYISLTAGMILNYSPKEINKLYRKLPITDKKDIAISASEIVKLLSIQFGNKISIIYNDLEINILNGKIKNNNGEIRKYLGQNKGKW